MKRILLSTQNQNDMTSYLRAWGVFTHPSMRNEVQILSKPTHNGWVFDWTYFYEADCIYLHRAGSTPAIDIRSIQMAKQHKIPLWVDMDDDLEAITPDNPSYATYNSEQVRYVIQMAIKEADVLTVGGQRHYDRLKKVRPDVILLPNSVDDRLLHLKQPFSDNYRIAWRGSESHRIDLHRFQDVIAIVMEEYLEREWTFFGLNPYQFEWLAPKARFRWLGQTNLMDYYVAITSNNASHHVVPLLDTEFNRVKSNLCWSDATLAGSVVLGPNFEEYQRPGVWLYEGGNPKNFLLELTRMLQASSRTLKAMHDNSWEWICDNILVSKVNQKRLEILKNL